VRLAREGLKVTLHSGDESGHPLLSGVPVQLDLPRGAILSVLALGDLRGLGLTGVRWPLQAADVPLGSGWTVSNEAAGGGVTATLEAGLALVTVLHPT
jgi:thiamine pyrophosphokinase